MLRGKKCRACKGVGCKACSMRGYLPPPSKPKRIKQASAKRQPKNELYKIQSRLFLLANKRCQVLTEAGRCPNPSTELHHRRGCSGSNLLDQSTWLATCRHCHHEKIHGQHRAWSEKMGYMLNRASQKAVTPPSNEFIPYDQ